MDRAAGVQSARGSGGARPPAVLSAAAQRQARWSSSKTKARGQIDPVLDRMASKRQGYSTGAKIGALQWSGRRWARRRRVGATKHAGERRSGSRRTYWPRQLVKKGREGGTDAYHGSELSRRAVQGVGVADRRRVAGGARGGRCRGKVRAPRLHRPELGEAAKEMRGSGRPEYQWS